MERRLLRWMLAGGLPLLASVSGAQTLWSGTLDDADAAFNRPSSLGGISFTGTAVRYDVQPFRVSADGDYVFESGQSYDGFILVYRTTFDPSSPLTNLVGGGDDFTPDLGSPNPSDTNELITPWTYDFGSKLDTPANGFGTLGLFSGTQYLAVTTAFANTDRGNYFNAIGGGPGTVTIGSVPEPATVVILASTLGILIRRRRGR